MKTSPRLTFTDEQQRLISSPGGAFVEACPGAGKTQAIVERFVVRPGDDPRRGVALLSFTNAAVDEVRMRCSYVQELLKAPNFVGTLDRFINRFITAPVYAMRFGRAAEFTDTWSDLHNTTFNTGHPAFEFRLGWFGFDVEGRADFNPRKVPWRQRRPYWYLPPQTVRQANTEATIMFEELLAGGLLDCEYSRLFMTACLEDEHLRKDLALLLAARFSEVIVDEVQDCSESDVRLLNFLVNSGIPMVLVGDPDQAIYDFRGSTYGATKQLSLRVPPGPRLSGNFRSSPAICSVVNSLRSTSAIDHAVGNNDGIDWPVLLLPVTTFSGQVATLKNLAAQHDLDSDSLLCLAHSTDDARELAGSIGTTTTGRGNLARIAAAADSLQHARYEGPREFRRHLASLSSRICELHPDPALRLVPDTDFFLGVKLEPREFRAGLLRVAYCAQPFTTDAASYRSTLIGTLKLLDWQWVDSERLPLPTSWPTPAVAPRSAATLRWKTVHRHKGLQAEAVALAIPQPLNARIGDDGVAHWERGTGHESRRVLYVGASRAEKLLILVVSDFHVSSVETILKRDGVPFTVVGR